MSIDDLLPSLRTRPLGLAAGVLIAAFTLASPALAQPKTPAKPAEPATKKPAKPAPQKPAPQKPGDPAKPGEAAKPEGAAPPADAPAKPEGAAPITTDLDNPALQPATGLVPPSPGPSPAPPPADPAAPPPGAPPPGAPPPGGWAPWPYPPPQGWDPYYMPYYPYDPQTAPYPMPVSVPEVPKKRFSAPLMGTGIAATSAGVVAVLTGSVLLATAHNRVEVYCDNPTPTLCGYLDDHSRKTAGVTTMIIGGVLSLAGIPMLIVGARKVPVQSEAPADGAPGSKPPGAPASPATPATSATPEAPKQPALAPPELRVGAGSAELFWRF